MKLHLVDLCVLKRRAGDNNSCESHDRTFMDRQVDAVRKLLHKVQSSKIKLDLNKDEAEYLEHVTGCPGCKAPSTRPHPRSNSA